MQISTTHSRFSLKDLGWSRVFVFIRSPMVWVRAKWAEKDSQFRLNRWRSFAVLSGDGKSSPPSWQWRSRRSRPKKNRILFWIVIARFTYDDIIFHRRRWVIPQPIIFLLPFSAKSVRFVSIISRAILSRYSTCGTSVTSGEQREKNPMNHLRSDAWMRSNKAGKFYRVAQ